MYNFIHIPYYLEKRISALFNQEVWCWNRDVLSTDGNLLLSYGFVLHKKQDDNSQKMYVLQTSKLFVGLWTWGMFYGEKGKGGVILKQDTDTVRAYYTSNNTTEIVFSPHSSLQFKSTNWACASDAAYELILKAMVFIYNYEQWIHQQKGISYREACVMDWVRPYCKGKEMKNSWQQMIFDLQLYLDSNTG